MLLPRTQLNGALSVAERIWKGASAHLIEAQKVTVSIGIACFPSGALKTPELLVRAADEALYRAKREGRDRILHRPDRGRASSPRRSRSAPNGALVFFKLRGPHCDAVAPPHNAHVFPYTQRLLAPARLALRPLATKNPQLPRLIAYELRRRSRESTLR